MLRRHLQLSADMMGHQLLEKALVRIRQQIIEPDPGADEHLFHPGHLSQTAEEMEIFAVIRLQRGAGLGRQTFFILAQSPL